MQRVKQTLVLYPNVSTLTRKRDTLFHIVSTMPPLIINKKHKNTRILFLMAMTVVIVTSNVQMEFFIVLLILNLW